MDISWFQSLRLDKSSMMQSSFATSYTLCAWLGSTSRGWLLGLGWLLLGRLCLRVFLLMAIEMAGDVGCLVGVVVELRICWSKLFGVGVVAAIIRCL